MEMSRVWGQWELREGSQGSLRYLTCILESGKSLSVSLFGSLQRFAVLRGAHLWYLTCILESGKPLSVSLSLALCNALLCFEAHI